MPRKFHWAMLTMSIGHLWAQAALRPQRNVISVHDRFEARTLAMKPGTTYSVSLSAIDSESLTGSQAIQVEIGNLRKRLYWGDQNLFTLYSPEQSRIELILRPSGLREPHKVRLEVLPISASSKELLSLEREPNDTWQTANPIQLGQAVFGTADDIEYLNNKDEGKLGSDWFRFDFAGPEPKLVYFSLDIVDRDVPANIRLFRADNGKLQEYENGKSPGESIHDNQTVVRNKFITRVLIPGRYYLDILGNHPYYVLESKLYDVPPYADPRKAVRVAMDFMLNQADNWFHYIPRFGSVRDRADIVPSETERCTACHVAHFPMRSTLLAFEHGYPIEQKTQFRYLIDRLYNAMAPMFGLKDDYWTRFDVAPQNGIVRISDMLLRYENSISHRRTDIPFRSLGYLRMVYRDNRTLVTEAENDGNRPVSGFKIARDAWTVFQASGDQQKSEQLLRLIESSPTNDFEDLCEQTIGMLYSDPARFRSRVDDNVKRILAKQHDDGGWTSVFYSTTDNNVRFRDPKTHFVLRPDFHEQPSDVSNQAMTGLALYTLALAGVPKDHPQVEKATQYLLPKLKEFGAWLDPNGEASITPFLETKWAIISLSKIFPGPGFQKPIKPELPSPMPDSMVARLLWLQRIYDTADISVIVKLLESPEPLLRTAAAHALGRIARDRTDQLMSSAVAPLVHCLSDPNKMVARVSAWALRQIGNSGIGQEQIRLALGSDDVGTRRWATRIFQLHFYHLAKNDQLAKALLARVSDPDALSRIHAIQALWRWWESSADLPLRSSIEDTLIGRFSAEREPLVRQNLTQALYNLLDENEGQLFNNWMTALQEPDRERLRKARIENQEHPLARKFAAAISKNSDELLRDGALSVFEHWFLRGGLGNDAEWINFLDPDAAQPLIRAATAQLVNENAAVRERSLRVAAALRRLGDPLVTAAVLDRLEDPVPDVRRLALRVESVLTPTRFVYDEFFDQNLPGLDKAKVGRSTTKFPYPKPEGNSERLTRLLGSVLPEAREGALEWLRRVPQERNPQLAQRVLQIAEAGKDPLAVANLDWVAKFADIQPALNASAISPLPKVRRAVVELLLRPDLPVPPAVQIKILAESSQELPVEVVNVFSKRPALLQHQQAVDVCVAIAARGQARERIRAVELLASTYKASPSEQVEQALRSQIQNLSVLVRQKAATALGLPAQTTTQSGSRTDVLDFQYFVNNVEPIFLKVRTGGARCYNCHSLENNRALLHLQPLGPDGTWTAEQSRLNYDSVLKVVNQSDPLQSRILLHPLAPDAGGDEFHSGGKLWTSKSDPDWQALSTWLQGASVGLNYQYFKQRIQPLLTKTYKDSNNQSCMSCHLEGNSMAADFRLLPPDSEGAIRRNYETTLLFVSPGDPNDSPFLTKPYNTTQRSIRDLTDQALIKRYVRGSGHDGGKFWWELTDPDFQIAYEWINQGIQH